MDTGHFHAAQVDTEAFIRRFPDRIYNVHIKDHIGTQLVDIDQGEIDLASILGVRQEVNYAGPLAVEMEVENTENLPQYIGPAYNHLAGILENM